MKKRTRPLTPAERHIEELRAEARYHRERRDLYQAKVHGRRPTSLARLEELRRTSALADSRLRRLEREAAGDEPKEDAAP